MAVRESLANLRCYTHLDSYIQVKENSSASRRIRTGKYSNPFAIPYIRGDFNTYGYWFIQTDHCCTEKHGETVKSCTVSTYPVA